jgi:dTDP-glucose pyrophosphorylase
LKNLSKLKLKISNSIEDAINVLHNGGMRVALVVDNNNKLLGTLTDGDIRRSILSHIDMTCSVKEIMNSKPSTALSSDSPETVMLKMKNRDLLHIPIVDIDNKLVGLETLQHLTYAKKYDNPIFLMAGGFGKRLHPLTEETPKPMLNIGSQPILETIIGRFIKAGFYNFYISTHYKADIISDYFGDGSDLGINIEYVNEEKPLGTAGSIALLPKNLPNLPIIMMNGDVLTKVNFEHLLKAHLDQKGIATMCIREYDIQIPFGVVDIKNQEAKSFLEKPIKKFFVNAGIYIFNPEMISKVKVGEKIDMPDLLEKQIKKGLKVSVFPIHEYWKDIGHINDFQNVSKSFDNGFSLDD